MSYGRSRVDVYDEPRVRRGNRAWEEIPWDEVEDVRNRELALVRRQDSRSPSPVSRAELVRYDDRAWDAPEEGEEAYTVRRVSKYRDGELVSYRRSVDDYEYNGREPQIARPEPYRGDRREYDEDRGERGGRRPRRDHDDRRAYSERRSAVSRRHRRHDDEESDQARLWYSEKDRRDANFFERTFDSSYDGLIAAAAGAAIGAITVRSFSKDDYARNPGEEKKKQFLLKTAGGAVAGAALFNVAENKYRVYMEEREEQKEEHESNGQDGRLRAGDLMDGGCNAALEFAH